MSVPQADPNPGLTTWHQLEADGLRLRYLAVEGPPGDAWIIFHGFGQKPAEWLPHAQALCHLGRVLVVELPAHGQSSALRQDKPISQAAWEHWITALCRKERVQTCNLLGYSLGGRLALASAHALKGRVEQLVLCAAEGAGHSLWYALATRWPLGRRLLKGMVFNPKWVLSTLKLLARIGLLNKSLARFATGQLQTRAQRRLVARSWLALRHLPGSLTALAEVLNRHTIPLLIVAGKHDKTVPMARMLPLARLVPHAGVQVLPVGHNRLPEATIGLLLKEHFD